MTFQILKSEWDKVFTSEIGTRARKFTCLSCKLLLVPILPVKSSSHLDYLLLFLQGCNILMAKISSQNYAQMFVVSAPIFLSMNNSKASLC